MATKKEDKQINRQATSANFKKLIKKGKKQGYITVEELLALFPEAEEDIEKLDSLYEDFMKEGIDVYDVASVEEAEQMSKLEEIDLSKIKLDKTVTSDPGVSIYGRNYLFKQVYEFSQHIF